MLRHFAFYFLRFCLFYIDLEGEYDSSDFYSIFFIALTGIFLNFDNNELIHSLISIIGQDIRKPFKIEERFKNWGNCWKRPENVTQIIRAEILTKSAFQKQKRGILRPKS